MATGSLSPEPWLTFVDANGVPLAGGLVYTYSAGTTTPVATYTDVGLTTPNANPIVLDSAGRCTAYLTVGIAYKFVVQTAAAVSVRTADNIQAVPITTNEVTGGTSGQVLTSTGPSTVATFQAPATNTGNVSIAGQTTGDFIYAGSATQLARLAASVNNGVPYYNSGWSMKFAAIVNSWAHVTNNGTATLVAGFGFSSVTRNSAGNVTLTFAVGSNAPVSANYAAVPSSIISSATDAQHGQSRIGAQATGNFNVLTGSDSGAVQFTDYDFNVIVLAP